ncbi:hypothetical protein Y1Q_0000968 [Alligator mississippiensis]|uniref:Uncharacterized protein n=1 Tax=Alligator mississippiensis TaxID=8496 RepID=A0A151NEL5_ALLMI|nr:hypothetical protein Y1Q_0000968 [Alligator mississippiensis]
MLLSYQAAASWFEEECSYWRKVLRCVVATVKLLSSLGLPLRGYDESSLSNRKEVWTKMLKATTIRNK